MEVGNLWWGYAVFLGCKVYAWWISLGMWGCAGYVEILIWAQNKEDSHVGVALNYLVSV